MSYSKKDLKDIKNKLKKENPSFFNNSSIKKQKKSIVKSQPSRKK